MRPRYFKLDGHEPVACTLDEWAECIERGDERRVALTRVGHAEISTVFLGLDHNHWGKGPAILFETMIFLDDGGTDDCWRYSTWAEAEVGHAKAVEMVREAAIVENVRQRDG